MARNRHQLLKGPLLVFFSLVGILVLPFAGHIDWNEHANEYWKLFGNDEFRPKLLGKCHGFRGEVMIKHIVLEDLAATLCL